MPIDVNGYNSVFKNFVQFAQQRVDANKAKAVVTASITKPLEGRAIMSIGTSKTDSVHKWTRGVDEWNANDRTRALFRKAIVDMFGSEAKIPESVKKAMILRSEEHTSELQSRI